MILPIIIIKSLIRNIERSRTTVLHIALCISVIVASFSLINGYEVSFTYATKSYATTNTILITNSTIGAPIDVEQISIINTYDVLCSYQIVGKMNVSSDHFVKHNITFYGANISTFLKIHEFRIIDGTYNLTSETIFVGAQFAYLNSIKVGTNLTISTRFFEWNVSVVGILNFDSPLDFSIFLNEPLGRVMLRLPQNYYNQIEVRLFKNEDLPKILSGLQSIHGISIFKERALSQVILDAVRQISISLWAMAIILFIITLSLIYQAGNHLIKSAKYEIGLLISMGTSRVYLFFLLLIQIIGIGMIASGIGVSIGIVISNIMSYVSSLFGEQLYAPSLPTFGLVGEIILASFLFTLIGGIIPIIQLMRTTPGELLQ